MMVNDRTQLALSMLRLAFGSSLIFNLMAANAAPSGTHETDESYKTLVRSGQFMQMRTFPDYLEAHGEFFRRKLSTLGAGDIWLDWGSGFDQAVAGYLLADTDAFGLPEPADRARVYAVGMPPTAEQRQKEPRIAETETALLRLGTKFYPFKEKLWEDLDVSRWPQLDLVSSYMGVFSYLPPQKLEEGMNAVLGLLKVGGEIHLVFNHTDFVLTDVKGDPLHRSTFENFFPYVELVRNFFSAIDGLELIHFNERAPNNDHALLFSVGLRKTRPIVRWPTLAPTVYSPGGKPPPRGFHWPDGDEISCRLFLQD